MDILATKMKDMGLQTAEDDPLQQGKSDSNNETDKMAEMDDSMDNEQTPAEQTSENVGVKQGKSLSELKGGWEYITSFKNSKEFLSKKASKDGLMDAVKNETLNAINTMNSLGREASDEDIVEHKEVFKAAKQACSNYVQKKNPFTSKGKKRKKAVENLELAFANLWETDADVLLNVVLDSRDKKLEELNQADVDYKKDTSIYSNYFSEQKKDKTNGIGALNQRKATAYATTLNKYGGYSDARAKADAPVMEMGTRDDRFTGAEVAKACEGYFKLVESANLSEYLMSSPEDILNKDIARMHYMTQMWFEGEVLINNYEKLVANGQRGLKYPKEKFLELRAKFEALEQISILYSGVEDILKDPATKDQGSAAYFKLLDEVDDPFYFMQQVPNLPPEQQGLYTTLFRMKGQMVDSGYKFGKTTVEDMLKQGRERALEHMRRSHINI